MADPSLEDTVNGILKFMNRKGIISVAPREHKEASAPRDYGHDRGLHRRYCFLNTSFSVRC